MNEYTKGGGLSSEGSSLADVREHRATEETGNDRRAALISWYEGEGWDTRASGATSQIMSAFSRFSSSWGERLARMSRWAISATSFTRGFHRGYQAALRDIRKDRRQ